MRQHSNLAKDGGGDGVGGFRGPGRPIAKKDHRCAVFLA